jgi:hypothetical protein
MTERGPAKYPTLDPNIRAVPTTSRLDGDGRPICVWCDKPLRWNTGWGYEGQGLFCSMRHAAEWANIKASAGCDD